MPDADNSSQVEDPANIEHAENRTGDDQSPVIPVSQQSTGETRRTQFMLTNLIVLVIFILCLVLMIIAYPILTAPDPTATPTITLTFAPTVTASLTPTTTPTPTQTLTPRPTLTPTITDAPSRTLPATLTPTLPGPPTLTPAIPLVDSGLYELKVWTPEDADYMVSLMNDYPNTLPQSARGEDNSAYYDAFVYATIAQKEGLLRFPDASQADSWRWGLAYNLAQIGDPEAGVVYADVIAQGLNRGEVDLSYLYVWFQNKEPSMSLHMVELTPISGYTASYLIEVRGPGSAFIWLLQTPSAYRAYALLSRFDFVNPLEAGWIVADLNGDSQDGDEIAVYFSALPGQYSLDAPHVFSLSQIPPQELPFVPDQDIINLGMDCDNYWAVNQNTNGGNDLLFKSTVFPACPTTVQRQYRWNGELFEFIGADYELSDTPLDLSYCEIIVDHAANTWGPEAAISIMEALLPDWPPEKDVDGIPYPADAKDEWRYRLGVYYGLLGEVTTAIDYMQDVVTNPIVSGSRWITPAQEFLDIYNQSEDIYQACVTATFCYPGYAVEYLIAQLPPGEDALVYLYRVGVPVSGSGYFDFDKDDQRERWFTVRHRPLEQLEFWILADYIEGTKALRVANVGAVQPNIVYLDEAYISEQALHLQPVVFLDSSMAFSMQRIPGTQEPYLVDVPLRAEYPDRFDLGVQAAQQALFDGSSPKGVQEDLLRLAEYPGLLCEATWSCDQYYYLLGLATELVGDQSGAIDVYHHLWENYSKSPYTIMARLKFTGTFVLATPTLTPTQTLPPTVTLAATSTPTITGTPPTATPSATLTPTVTGTPPTATPSATATPTLDPNITPTITPTMTPTGSVTPTNVTPSPYP